MAEARARRRKSPLRSSHRQPKNHRRRFRQKARPVAEQLPLFRQPLPAVEYVEDRRIDLVARDDIGFLERIVVADHVNGGAEDQDAPAGLKEQAGDGFPFAVHGAVAAVSRECRISALFAPLCSAA